MKMVTEKSRRKKPTTTVQKKENLKERKEIENIAGKMGKMED